MEKEMATHSSIRAWKSPWTEEPGRLQTMGLQDWACVHECGGRWVGSNKLVELKNKQINKQTRYQIWSLLHTALQITITGTMTFSILFYFFDFQYFNPHLMYAGPNWEINLISWPGISG